MSVKIQPGDDTHIKGFILHKLYIGMYFAKPGKKHHGKHTSVKNLPKGYPSEHRGKFSGYIKQLRTAGLIVLFPSCGEDHVCAVLDPDLVDVGLNLVNAYRQSVGLPPLPDRLGLKFKKK
jgi:hypothetical protein